MALWGKINRLFGYYGIDKVKCKANKLMYYVPLGTTVGGTLTQDTPLEDVYAEMVGSGVLLIFAGVFASVYSDEERKSGFLKNLTVGRSGKKYIFASKAPVLLLLCFLQSIL